MKIYPIICYRFGGYESFENTLKGLGVEFIVRDIFSTFWGKGYTIEKPRGKGAKSRERELLKLI